MLDRQKWEDNHVELEKVRAYVNQYGRLRDLQYAAYEMCARKHGLTAKELFGFSSDGCLQSEISDRMSATKQTISAIIKKFWKLGYLSLTESENDRRNKIVRFTDAGLEYAKGIVPPAARAEINAMADMADEDIVELLRLTTVFSENMKVKFSSLREEM